MKDAFAGKNLLLTAAIGAPTGLMDQSYDIPEISKYLDYIYIMSYDYHGLWDKKVNSHAPLKSDDGLSVVKNTFSNNYHSRFVFFSFHSRKQA